MEVVGELRASELVADERLPEVAEVDQRHQAVVVGREAASYCSSLLSAEVLVGRGNSRLFCRLVSAVEDVAWYLCGAGLAWWRRFVDRVDRWVAWEQAPLAQPL